MTTVTSGSPGLISPGFVIEKILSGLPVDRVGPDAVALVAPSPWKILKTETVSGDIFLPASLVCGQA